MPGDRFQITWQVSTDTDRETVPAFRLRVNDTFQRDSVVRVVTSSSTGQGSPDNGQLFYTTIYEVPSFVEFITLSLDLLSFDLSDDLTAYVELNSVCVQRR